MKVLREPPPVATGRPPAPNLEPKTQITFQEFIMSQNRQRNIKRDVTVKCEQDGKSAVSVSTALPLASSLSQELVCPHGNINCDNKQVVSKTVARSQSNQSNVRKAEQLGTSPPSNKSHVRKVEEAGNSSPSHMSNVRKAEQSGTTPPSAFGPSRLPTPKMGRTSFTASGQFASSRKSNIPGPRKTNPGSPASVPSHGTPQTPQPLQTPIVDLGTGGSSSSASTTAQIPKSRFQKLDNTDSPAPVSTRGTPKNLSLNKDLPPKPDMPPLTPKGSGIPVKARTTLNITEDSPNVTFHDNDSFLDLPDGHRRSVKLGLSGPTVRFSKDCDEGIMGTDNDNKQKDKKVKKEKVKTQGDIAASFRSNRTTDSMIESRFARPTITATLRGSEVKPESLKSRMSAMLTRRTRASQAPATAPVVAPVIAPVNAPTITPDGPLFAAPVSDRTSDELFEAGLRQLGVALAAFGQAASAAAGSDEASQFTTRVRTIVTRVTQINTARLARLDVLTHLDALAVAEVVGISEAVTELNELTREL